MPSGPSSSNSKEPSNKSKKTVTKLVQMHRHVLKTNLGDTAHPCRPGEEIISVPRTSQIHHHHPHPLISKRTVSNHKNSEIEFAIHIQKRCWTRSKRISQENIRDTHPAQSLVPPSGIADKLTWRVIPARFLFSRCNLLLHVQQNACRQQLHPWQEDADR